MKTLIKFLEPYEKELMKQKIKGIIIAVSGPVGSGTSTIAKSISSQLNLRYSYPSKIFRATTKKRKISLEALSRTRPAEMDYSVEKLTLREGLKGDVVIDARLAGWVTGEWATCKIWVQCPLKIRAKRVAVRDNISFKEALKRVKDRDRADRKKYLKLYGIDMLNTKIYDVILDNSGSKKDLENKLKVIVQKIKSEIRS